MRTFGNWLTPAIFCAALSMSFANRTAADEPIALAPATHDPATVADEKIIKKNQTEHPRPLRCWRRQSGTWQPIGRPTASFVDAEGKTFRGRKAIEKEFAEFFAESKGLKLEVSMDTLRFIAPGVAMESGTSRVFGGSDDVSATDGRTASSTSRKMANGF